MYCSYYRAKIEKIHHLFVVGAFKYYDHLCFDRTFDAQEGILEFYVPKDQEKEFLTVINRMEQKGIAINLEEKPNPLI